MGLFSVTHIISLIVAAGIIAGLYFALRKAPQKVQTWILGILSLSGLAAIFRDLWPFDNVLPNLPLHLCSLNAMVLPFAVFTRNKTLGNLLLGWSLGALAALVLNNEAAGQIVFSWDFNFYYFPHVFECGVPILLFLLGHVKKDHKCIASTLAITWVSYTVIHFINRGLNAYSAANGLGFEVNFMFSIKPNNPLTELLYQWVPHEYWYMLLVLPIVAVYLGLVYLPQFCRAIRERKEKKIPA